MSQFLKLTFTIAIISISSCAVNNSFLSRWEEDIRFNSDTYSNTEAIYYNPTDAISLKIFNNEKYLDLILETNSANTLRKIYNLGLSIWIDSKGKMQNTYAINFPMPSQFPYTPLTFRNYLNKFSMIEFNEELLDRFQTYEVLNRKTNKNISASILASEKEDIQLKLSTKKEVLFSYHLRIKLSDLFTDKIAKQNISIGISSINEASEEYFSAMSSKEYINKRLDKLKAGINDKPHELTEWWTSIKLAEKSN